MALSESYESQSWKKPEKFSAAELRLALFEIAAGEFVVLVETLCLFNSVKLRRLLYLKLKLNYKIIIYIFVYVFTSSFRKN